MQFDSDLENESGFIITEHEDGFVGGPIRELRFQLVHESDIIATMNELAGGVKGLPRCVCKMIQRREFSQLRTFFQDETKQVNLYIESPHCKMTCLEYAVRCGDVLMLLFFLVVLGADPQHNCFDGTERFRYGEGYYRQPVQLCPERFLGEARPIQGFQGLEAILDCYGEGGGDWERLLAVLPLMEWLLVSTPNCSKDDIIEAIANLRRFAGPHSAVLVDYFKDTVLSAQLALRKHAPGLEDLVATDILSHVAKNCLWIMFSRVIEQATEEAEQQAEKDEDEKESITLLFHDDGDINHFISTEPNEEYDQEEQEIRRDVAGLR